MEKINDDHEDLLGAALAVAQTIDDFERSEIVAAIAFEYGQRKELQKAVEIAESIQDPYVRDQAMSQLAALSVEAGNSDYADELLNSIEDPSLLTVAIEQVALRHAQHGDFETALQLTSELADSAEAVGGIAVTYALKGFPQEAVELALSIEPSLPRTLTLLQLAVEAQKLSRVDAAEELLTEAIQSAADIEFPEDQVDALISIANVYEMLGKPDAAFEQLMGAYRICNDIESTSGVITATSVRDQALAQITVALANLKFFDKAVEVIETIEDPFQFAVASRPLAIAYHQNQRQAEATELLAQAVEITQEADVIGDQGVALQEDVFSKLAYGYALNGQFQESLEVAELVHTVSLKTQLLEEIGKVAARAGADPAMISESIPDSRCASSFWVTLSDTYTELVRPEQSDRAITKALECAGKGEQPYEQASAFNEIGTRLASKDRPGEASQLFRRALSTIPSIASSNRKALMLLDMARKYRTLGRELSDEEMGLLREIVFKAES